MVRELAVQTLRLEFQKLLWLEIRHEWRGNFRTLNKKFHTISLHTTALDICVHGFTDIRVFNAHRLVWTSIRTTRERVWSTNSEREREGYFIRSYTFTPDTSTFVLLVLCSVRERVRSRNFRTFVLLVPPITRERVRSTNSARGKSISNSSREGKSISYVRRFVFRTFEQSYLSYVVLHVEELEVEIWRGRGRVVCTFAYSYFVFRTFVLSYFSYLILHVKEYEVRILRGGRVFLIFQGSGRVFSTFEHFYSGHSYIRTSHTLYNMWKSTK